MNLKISLFEDKSISLEDLLKGNNAKWHKSYNRKFNTTELKRAEKCISAVCSDRLKQIGIDIPTIHSTRLKDKILSNFPDLQAHKECRTNLLAFNADVGPALKK